MVVNPLLALAFWKNLLAVIFVVCAIVLVLIVLIQKGKGGGLSGAFGGAGGSGGVLGTKTGDFLTWFTIGLAALFILLAIVMAKIYKPSISEQGTTPVQQQVPATPDTGETDVNLPAK